MSNLRKISFGGFLIVALGLCTNGIVYILAKEIMPYHQTAMGVPWSELTEGIQVMSLNFMRSAGVGFLTTGVNICLLLIFAFKKNEHWADWAIAIIASTEIILIIIRTMDVASKTPANPPTMPLIIAVAIVIVCFLLTIIDYRKQKVK